MKVLRLITRKSRRNRMRNEIIKEEVSVSSLLLQIDAAQLRWLRHLERIDKVRLATKKIDSGTGRKMITEKTKKKMEG